MPFDLSQEAQRALAAPCPALVLGGPGSGKTPLSFLKAQRLILELAPGQEVLFLSFSRAAVHQVLARCKDVLSSEERRCIAVKTYHAFSMEILKAHGRLTSGRQPRVLFPRQENLRKSAHDGDWKTERRRLENEEALYSFDRFAEYCAALLADAECVRELLSDRHPTIILDEFQDTDDSQWALVRQLAKSSKLIVLADPDQRIFDYDPTVDPRRLQQLRDHLSPAEFDLGTENHRSPGSGILSFADAVLRNRPLPVVSEVAQRSFWPSGFDAGVHANVVWMLSALRNAGVAHPSVAVLCRANSLVLKLSDVLRADHKFNRVEYAPVEHVVMWDAERSAAAASVIASIMTWPDHANAAASAAQTVDALAEFYDVKNAAKASKSARNTAESYRRAAERIRAGQAPSTKASKIVLSSAEQGIDLTGSPVEDWKRAQAILIGAPQLEEVRRDSRLVRLFNASGEIGPELAAQWSRSGSYGDARSIVQRSLDRALLLSAKADPRGVVLMNIHKSKGKEFDGVVLVEGAHAGALIGGVQEPPPYHASRRLLRVGITRARHRVTIIRPNGALQLVGNYT